MIKRIIKQTVLGYSADFLEVHIQHLFECEDGSKVTKYTTSIRDNEGIVIGGPFSDIMPIVAVPVGDIK